ncbi:MAG: GlsB/YeaQ/YmgE family stress response membrane protein [Acidimicrobiia bacterium]|nr:GlsB/YeaQ/YmgE family stress response membrane protein [Acidimicrobiia bacterium]
MILLVIIVWGMFAGWVAHLLVGRGAASWGELLVVGLAGSLVGGLVASLVAGDGLDLRPSGIIGSVLGAVVLLLVVQAVRGRPSRRADPRHR